MTGLDVTLESQEREKYAQAWATPEYREACHGLALLQARPELFRLSPGMHILDIGCGTGRLFGYLNENGYNCWAIDIASNCLDEDVQARWGCDLYVAPLWVKVFGYSEFELGICTDVMEHIPPEKVDDTLAAIGRCCDRVIFKIAHVPDVCGGGSYHLTVQPVSWWMGRMGAAVPGSVVTMHGHVERSGFEDSIIEWVIR
jgi:SAM-dependent methyltransferase